MLSMPGSTSSTWRRRPSLTVLRGDPGWREDLAREEASRGEAEPPALHVVRNSHPLLVAGADAARRAALLDDLIDTMPDGTRFEEASTLSEVLERAPTS